MIAGPSGCVIAVHDSAHTQLSDHGGSVLSVKVLGLLSVSEPSGVVRADVLRELGYLLLAPLTKSACWSANRNCPVVDKLIKKHGWKLAVTDCASAYDAALPASWSLSAEVCN